MVSYIPSNDPWGKVGESFSRGFSNAFNEQKQFSVQQSRFQEALKKLENVRGKDGQIDPIALATKGMAAFAGIPGGAQAFSDLYPLLLKEAQRKAGVGNDSSQNIYGVMPDAINETLDSRKGKPVSAPPPPLAPKTNVSDDPRMRAIQTSEQRKAQNKNLVESQQNTASGSEGIQFQGRSFVPTQDLLPRSPFTDIRFGDGFVPKIFGPQDFTKMQEKLSEEGALGVELIPKVEKIMEDYNRRSRDQYGDVEKALNIETAVDSENIRRQEQVRDIVEKRFPSLKEKPGELLLAERYANEFIQKHPKGKLVETESFVRRKIEEMQLNKKNLEKSLTSPRFQLFGLPPKKLKPKEVQLARTSAKYLAKEGQLGQMREIIGGRGYGQEEEANLINPLKPDEEKLIETLPKLRDFRHESAGALYMTPQLEERMAAIDDSNQKTKELHEEALSKIIKGGDLEGDFENLGTSLILTRRALIDKGYSYLDAGKLIDDVINKYEIKLSPYQRSEHALLLYPPLTGETYIRQGINYIMGNH